MPPAVEGWSPNHWTAREAPMFWTVWSWVGDAASLGFSFPSMKWSEPRSRAGEDDKRVSGLQGCS